MLHMQRLTKTNARLAMINWVCKLVTDQAKNNKNVNVDALINLSIQNTVMSERYGLAHGIAETEMPGSCWKKVTVVKYSL